MTAVVAEMVDESQDQVVQSIISLMSSARDLSAQKADGKFMFPEFQKLFCPSYIENPMTNGQTE